MLRLTMLLLGFPRDGMVVDRLLEALARDAVVGLSAPPTKSERFILRSSERTARDARRLGVCFSSFRRASPSETRKVAQYECQCGQRRLQLVRNVVMCPLMAWFKYVSRTRRGYAFEFKSVDGSGHVAVIYRAWRSFQAANHPQVASLWRFPDSEWTHGHDHRHGWALGKQIVPQHVFGEDDENKRGFYIQIGIFKVKSLNLGVWLYFIGFLFGWGASLQWHPPHIYVATYILYKYIYILYII